MKITIYFISFLLIANHIFSQPLTLVKDINVSQSNNYNNQVQFSSLVNVNGYLFMSLYKPEYGNELWKVNEQTGKANLVKDIYPGAGYSFISGLTAYNGKMYFQATDGIHGSELWMSDGTNQGTLMIKDISPGQNSSYPYNFFIYNGLLFFSADGEFWRTDGSAIGTLLVKDINPGINASQPVGFTVMNSIIYFSATDAIRGRELWRSDGTENGTFLVRDIYPETDVFAGPGSSNPGRFVICNNILYFSADSYDYGREIWKTDGTNAGTTIVKDIFPGKATSNPLGSYAVLNDKLYFRAFGINGGDDLWVTDGSLNGTKIVKKLYPGPFGITTPIITLNGSIIFEAFSFTGNRDLWKSDGTDAGTIPFSPVSGYNDVSFFVADSSFLYFAASDPSHGRELWRTNGTASGTMLLQDIEPGVTNSDPFYFQIINGTIYLQARTSQFGNSIWKSNNNKDSLANFLSFAMGTGSSYPENFCLFNNLLFFTANDSVHGVELWKSDGTVNGTAIVKDITPGPAGSYNGDLITANNNLYFRANQFLWKTDGSLSGTAIVDSNLSLTGAKSIALDGLIYFVAIDYSKGFNSKIWKTDGTKAGTTMIEDISSPGYFNPGELFVFNKVVYFRANSSLYGEEIWKINSGDSIATLLRDIYPGITSGYPSNFMAGKNNFMFTAFDLHNVSRFWSSDGTVAGTKMIENMLVPSYVNTNNFAIKNGFLYFPAADSAHGIELWKSDGTAAGTNLVADINPGPKNTLITNITSLDSLVLFDAYEPGHGTELWRTDGTVLGTKLVKETWTGPQGNSDGEVISAYKPGISNSKLLITRNDGIHGEEPWISNGTEEGTLMIQDIGEGSGGSQPNHYISVGDRIFLTVETLSTGRELWSGLIRDIFPKFTLEFSVKMDHNKYALLEWKTINESGLQTFEVQRSEDKTNFSTIGHVFAIGSIGHRADYTFSDPNINQLKVSAIFYRLRLIEKSGASNFSDTLQLVIHDEVKVWPNPATTDINISLKLTESQTIAFVIRNANGSAISQWEMNLDAGFHQKKFIVDHLPAGSYYVNIKGKFIQQLIPFIVL